jgi:hypothetical protein
MGHPLLERPRTRAQARRRQSVALTALVVVGAVGIPPLYALVGTAVHNLTADHYVCYIDPSPDGTWTGINFDAKAGIPDDCTLKVWEDPNL